jgi:anti-sigma B factor antagonist
MSKNEAVTPNRGRATKERHRDAWIVSLHGEHDIDPLASVREQLAETRIAGGLVVVDLTAATFIDSSVLGALFEAHRADAPPRLRFIAPSETPARRLFDFVGFEAMIPIFERLEDAVAYSELG